MLVQWIPRKYFDQNSFLSVQFGGVPVITPILPYVEQEVKFVADLIYLFQCPEYKNGSVPNLLSPCAGPDAVLLLLTDDKQYVA